MFELRKRCGPRSYTVLLLGRRRPIDFTSLQQAKLLQSASTLFSISSRGEKAKAVSNKQERAIYKLSESPRECSSSSRRAIGQQPGEDLVGEPSFSGDGVSLVEVSRTKKMNRVPSLPNYFNLDGHENSWNSSPSSGFLDNLDTSSSIMSPTHTKSRSSLMSWESGSGRLRKELVRGLCKSSVYRLGSMGSRSLKNPKKIIRKNTSRVSRVKHSNSQETKASAKLVASRTPIFLSQKSRTL